MNTIDLNEFDGENAFYHFTSRDNYESISLNGLIPSIGDNANGIEKHLKYSFQKETLVFLEYVMYGLTGSYIELVYIIQFLNIKTLLRKKE